MLIHKYFEEKKRIDSNNTLLFVFLLRAVHSYHIGVYNNEELMIPALCSVICLYKKG